MPCQVSHKLCTKSSESLREQDWCVVLCFFHFVIQFGRTCWRNSDWNRAGELPLGSDLLGEQSDWQGRFGVDSKFAETKSNPEKVSSSKVAVKHQTQK
jgi:hypothetical protein